MGAALASFPDLSTDRRAWTASTIDNPGQWCYPLSEECLTALEATLAEIRRQPRPTTKVNLADFPALRKRDYLEAAHGALEKGRGFAVVTGMPPERFTRDDLQILYWLVGQMLGRPFEQNVQGTLLYDVRNTGQQLSQGARFSVTNYESSFHTDNSFGDDILDYVGLLCLRGAKSGGVSQVVSGYAVYEELRRKHPEALAVLCQPFHVDRRGGIKEGQGPTAQFPVIGWYGAEPLYRYLRYWIQEGHQKIDQPLTHAQLDALDVLDRVLQRPDLRVEFLLKPGEMFFINNRWILHNRTAFEDFDDLENRRHYVRLWLQV